MLTELGGKLAAWTFTAGLKRIPAERREDPGLEAGTASGAACLRTHTERSLAALFGVIRSSPLDPRGTSGRDAEMSLRSSQSLVIFSQFFLYSEVLQSDLQYCFQSDS